MDIQDINLCYMMIASVLGMRYHGLPMRAGFADVGALEAVLAPDQPQEQTPWLVVVLGSHVRSSRAHLHVVSTATTTRPPDLNSREL